MSRSCWAALGIVLALCSAGVSADALPPPPRCPRAPHDGGGCGAHRIGTACRYPGAVCACQAVVIDGRTRRRWVCGEDGE